MKKWLSMLLATTSVVVAAAGVSASAVSNTMQVVDAEGNTIPAEFKMHLDKLTNDKTCLAQQMKFIKDGLRGGLTTAKLSACDNLEASLNTGKASVKANPSDIGTQASTITLYSDPMTRYKVGPVTFWRARTGQRFTFENNNGKREIQWFSDKPTMFCSGIAGWTCTAHNDTSATAWQQKPITIHAHGDYDFTNSILKENVSFAHDGELTWNGTSTWQDGNPLD